jgi:hypothetical protein
MAVPNSGLLPALAVIACLPLVIVGVPLLFTPFTLPLGLLLLGVAAGLASIGK